MQGVDTHSYIDFGALTSTVLSFYREQNHIFWLYSVRFRSSHIFVIAFPSWARFSEAAAADLCESLRPCILTSSHRSQFRVPIIEIPRISPVGCRCSSSLAADNYAHKGGCEVALSLKWKVALRLFDACWKCALPWYRDSNLCAKLNERRTQKIYVLSQGGSPGWVSARRSYLDPWLAMTIVLEPTGVLPWFNSHLRATWTGEQVWIRHQMDFYRDRQRCHHPYATIYPKIYMFPDDSAVSSQARL